MTESDQHSEIMDFEAFKALSFGEQVDVLKSLIARYKISDISRAWGFNHPASYYYFLRDQGLHAHVVGKGKRGRPRRKNTVPQSVTKMSTQTETQMQTQQQISRQVAIQGGAGIGIVRRIDNLGRIVLPQEIRDVHNMEQGFPLELYEDPDQQQVILKPYRPVGICMECGSDHDVVPFKRMFVCKSCMQQIVGMTMDNEAKQQVTYKDHEPMV